MGMLLLLVSRACGVAIWVDGIALNVTRVCRTLFPDDARGCLGFGMNAGVRALDKHCIVEDGSVVNVTRLGRLAACDIHD